MRTPQIPELTVYTGGMWSGKTRSMISELELALIAHLKVLLFRPAKDTRSIRPGCEFSGRTIVVASAKEILDHDIASYDVIGIDELQQFDPEVISVIRALLQMGKDVHTAGLDLDFKADPFMIVAIAMALADHIVKKKSVCMKCRSRNGTRSQRLTDNQDVVDIGGEDKYEPRCYSCYVLPNSVVHSDDAPSGNAVTSTDPLPS
jgi:thymidine kinase